MGLDLARRSRHDDSMKPSPDAIASESATIEIDAEPEAVYRLVTAIERMGEWSPEAVGGRWLDGGVGNVGDRFEGHTSSSRHEADGGGRLEPVALASRARRIAYRSTCSWCCTPCSHAVAS